MSMCDEAALDARFPPGRQDPCLRPEALRPPVTSRQHNGEVGQPFALTSSDGIYLIAAVVVGSHVVRELLP